MNQSSLADQLIAEFDRGLRTLTRQNSSAQRENPANLHAEQNLSEKDRQTAGRLMRVNHAGEVAAQGLYHGQALTARTEQTQQRMQISAREEEDHMAWCEQRLDELQTPRSLISPLWYFGSYAIGASAGFFGDRWSLGFVSETETQVEQHITNHLNKLPIDDQKSRAILNQMKIDEIHHGQAARDLGGVDLPKPIKKAMKLISKVMTTGAYWI